MKLLSKKPGQFHTVNDPLPRDHDLSAHVLNTTSSLH